MIPRYLLNFNLDKLGRKVYDFIVVGSGIAGLWVSLKASKYGKVALLTKGNLEESATKQAQGGIAVALAPLDSPELHLADTLSAGAGLCDAEACEILVREGPERIEELIALGVRFDKLNEEYALGREGGHSRRRILHSRGDATGEEIEEVLAKEVRKTEGIDIFENLFVVDLLIEENRCVGLLALDCLSKELCAFLAAVIFLSTGGLGQLYKVTTNPEISTGDGLAMAYRAGAELVDLEFIQFHPTALWHDKLPLFLISEAVRGEGGVLRNINGERFMLKYHSEAELAPRDIVTRGIVEEMKKTGIDRVFLDVSRISDFQTKFPTIFRVCQETGLNVPREYIPITPAAHYLMGGIKTNTFGETNLLGLYAVGETACTGVHGANRLASNSLLEGLVFGNRAAQRAAEYAKSMRARWSENLKIEYQKPREYKEIDVEIYKKELQEIMWEKVGIVRSEASLETARSQLGQLGDFLEWQLPERKFLELQNMIIVSNLVVQSAKERQESRGSHYRADFPQRDDKNWKRHIVLKIEHVEGV